MIILLNIMNREVIKEILKWGPRPLMGKGLKYVAIDKPGEKIDFVWGNGRILGSFKGDFEQFNDYAFGGIRVNNYRFYLEDGTPLTKNSYKEWMLEDADKIKEKYKNKLNGSNDVLIAKDADNENWYFLFPDGKRVKEEHVWQE